MCCLCVARCQQEAQDPVELQVGVADHMLGFNCNTIITKISTDALAQGRLHKCV